MGKPKNGEKIGYCVAYKPDYDDAVYVDEHSDSLIEALSTADGYNQSDGAWAVVVELKVVG